MGSPIMRVSDTCNFHSLLATAEGAFGCLLRVLWDVLAVCRTCTGLLLHSPLESAASKPRSRPSNAHAHRSFSVDLQDDDGTGRDFGTFLGMPEDDEWIL